MSRKSAISRVVEALAREICKQGTVLEAVRVQAEEQVAAVQLPSDLRLVDIVIWTSQDDRMERVGRPAERLAPPARGPRKSHFMS